MSRAAALVEANVLNTHIRVGHETLDDRKSLYQMSFWLLVGNTSIVLSALAMPTCSNSGERSARV
ncbi:MAG: hypothetical protein OXD42_14400 [Rhodospirillaceae bacterium]|nr:hypothetical protein [Rhodospirillaceae bacterium]